MSFMLGKDIDESLMSLRPNDNSLYVHREADREHHARSKDP